MNAPTHIAVEAVAPKGWEVCVAVGTVILSVIVGFLLYVWILPPPDGDVSQLNTATLMAIQSVALALALAPMFIWRGNAAPRAFGFAPASARGIAKWSIVLLVVSFALDQTIIPISRWLGDGTETLSVTLVIEESLAKGGLTVTLFSIAILAPLGEEIFFRGVLFGWLRSRMRLQWAVLLQAILFGVVHLEPVHILIATGIGVGLGIAREYTRSLWPAIGAHCLINAVAVMEVYLRLDGFATG